MINLGDNNAYFEHIMYLTNTKLIKIKNNIVGYFTMEFQSVQIPVDYDENNYPVICLKYLAIDLRYENKRIGSSILDIIISQSKEISEFIGVRCLYIDAATDKIQWYKDRGFDFVDENNINWDTTTIPMFIDFRDNKVVYDYFDE